ncbi:uncharacterized protein BX663DRAFT_527202 [Cokeromyces recurvatus]|uniref:uncharacterized protein n=1 Tax=Cokeromyces recurvatus TaxID=90255 RepID=UPI002220901B|nr:uncharacterized protein BX663DRAFT_527202 [Cokeromyces recurvatus]KAI7897790.1 hypothetical protein BX663DRAFT_527202 [Cokeromyces recurvatus]
MQSNVISEQAESCSEQGNEYPFCYPTFTDVWRNGSTYDFIWNFNYPYYVQHEYLNLYLYYYIKFEYKNVKNFTRLDQSLGSVKVTVDDSWFLSPLEPGSLDLNLTLYGFYLPSTENVTEELSNPISMYPRPFNFTITRKYFNITCKDGISFR